MAARRLVILLLVMLGISTLAAALVPAPSETPDEASTTTTTRKAAEEPRGRLIRRRVDARDGPQIVRMRVGDQLQLAVAAARADQVEIRGLGELGEVDPDTPARFDLLPFERGTYPIRLLDARRTVGRIEVRPARKRGPGKGEKKASST